MEFVDLKEQYRRLKPGMDASVLQVLGEGEYIHGPQVAQLEQQLARYIGARHCVTVANGTDALLLALMACGIGPGDGVLTTPFSFFATAEVISLVGATPIFCDVSLDTYNMDPFCLEQMIKRFGGRDGLRLRGVIPVDLYGLPADYDAIEQICHHHNLELIEDAAQSFGGTYGEKKAGSFGRFGCTSFFPSKPLGCYGDGGAIFTNSDADAKKLRSLQVHGKGEHKYDNHLVGINSRLDTIQAAILKEKFKVFPQEQADRNKIVAWYDERLQGRVKVPVKPKGSQSAHALYTVALPVGTDRDSIQRIMTQEGIPTQVYYPVPLHRQPVYRDQWRLPMPNAEQAAATVLSLPMHPYLEEEQVDHICQVLVSALEQVSL